MYQSCHVLSLIVAAAVVLVTSTLRAAEVPNIVWITAEDMSADLGCYGDPVARTPHIDELAQDGVRYTRAFATAPVCSPARACLITGVYATSLGNPHLRCEIRLPNDIRGYAAYLRDAGYFTTNNVKTDYNLEQEAAFVERCWDRNSPHAHWRQRAEGQPFFAVFNLMETHQSRSNVWPAAQFEQEIGSKLPPQQRTPPAQVQLPPYYPDTPLARTTLARYYDCIQAMDLEVGRILQQLEQDGLADETIVFFYSDHGMGLPRGKRCLYDSGMHVPLIVRFPERWQALAPAGAGQTLDRLVSFIDFAPTVLSLTGVPVPRHMQGVAFLGSAAGTERRYVFGARDRVDEVFDTARSVRNDRWLYIRNYRPHLSWAQPEAYSDLSPFRRELMALAKSGQLNAAATNYVSSTRPLEELYDTQADPHQLHNLAGAPQHRAVLAELRGELKQWLLESRDLGFLPESDLHQRAATSTPYEMARQPGVYPLEPILAAAELVGQEGQVAKQQELLTAADPAVRYWAAVGLKAAGQRGAPAQAALQRAVTASEASVVRTAAATALVQLGYNRALPVLLEELQADDWNASLYAARSLQLLDAAAEPAHRVMRERLEHARQHEAQQTLAMFVRFALEEALDTASPPEGSAANPD